MSNKKVDFRIFLLAAGSVAVEIGECIAHAEHGSRNGKDVRNWEFLMEAKDRDLELIYGEAVQQGYDLSVLRPHVEQMIELAKETKSHALRRGY